jgi:hypothetical protein
MNSWENLDSEILLLRQMELEQGNSAPTANDISLLWSAIAYAAASATVEKGDIQVLLTIVSRIEERWLYEYIDGGQSEVERVRKLLVGLRQT